MNAIKGALAFLQAMLRLFTQPKLRAVVWRMLLLLLVLMGVVIVGAVFFFHYLLVLFMPSGDAWYLDLLGWLMWLASVLLAIAVALAGYTLLGSVAASPWLEELCRRTAALEGKEIKSSERSLIQTVLNSIVQAAMPLVSILPWAGASLLLFFIPGIGTFLAGLVGLFIGVRLLAFEFLDAPASVHGWGWEEKKRLWQQRRAFFLGFAAMASLFMLVPGLNLFVLPAGVVGAMSALTQAEKV